MIDPLMSGLQFLPSLMVQCNITQQKPTDNAMTKGKEKTLRMEWVGSSCSTKNKHTL